MIFTPFAYTGLTLTRKKEIQAKSIKVKSIVDDTFVVNPYFIYVCVFVCQLIDQIEKFIEKKKSNN